MRDKKNLQVPILITNNKRTLNIKPVMIDIRSYNGEKKFEFMVGSKKRTGRIDSIGKGIYIVGNDPECFNDVRFIEYSAKLMAKILKPYHLDCLLMPVTRSLMTGIEVARNLKLKEIAVARRNISPTPPKQYEARASSITSGEKKYFIDGETLQILRKSKRLGIFDDVISTTETIQAMKQIANIAGAKVRVISTVAIEGVEIYRKLEPEIREGRLKYLTVLPIFCKKSVYKELKKQEAEIKARYADWLVLKSDLKP